MYKFSERRKEKKNNGSSNDKDREIRLYCYSILLLKQCHFF